MLENHNTHKQISGNKIIISLQLFYMFSLTSCVETWKKMPFFFLFDRILVLERKHELLKFIKYLRRIY